MNVSLTPELEELVATKVKSGRYLSASEVIRASLRLLEHRDLLRDAQLRDARKKIKQGLDQLDRGEGLPGEQVYEELRQRRTRLGRNK